MNDSYQIEKIDPINNIAKNIKNKKIRDCEIAKALQELHPTYPVSVKISKLLKRKRPKLHSILTKK